MIPENIKHKESKNKDNGVLGLMILFFPMLSLPALAESIGGNIPEVAMSIILVMLGSAIGSSLYFISKDKSKSVKYCILGLMIVGFISAVIFFGNRTESEKRDLITCNICGYIALEKNGEECNVCLAEVSDEFKYENGYLTLEELVKEEQLYFFAMEDGVTFEKPDIIIDANLKYRKDENWSPIVSKDEVEVRRKEMDEL